MTAGHSRSAERPDGDFLKDPPRAYKANSEELESSDGSTRPESPKALSAPAAGDPPAKLGPIYIQWARFVWRSLQRLGVRQRDLDDVCHDVFIVVQRKLPEFDHRANVQSWLFGICLRVAANYRRRAYVRLEQPAGGLNAEDEMAVLAIESNRPDHEAERSRLLAFAESILARMHPMKRAVFVMFEVEGIGCPEIAMELGVPVGTVYSRLHAARKFFLAHTAQYRGAITGSEP